MGNLKAIEQMRRLAKRRAEAAAGNERSIANLAALEVTSGVVPERVKPVGAAALPAHGQDGYCDACIRSERTA
jgi:hypothetical protein